MEVKRRNCHREKAIQRKAVLEKKRLIEGMIKAACSVKDHLSCFPHLRHYQKNGLYLHLESGRGNKLSHCAKQFIRDLLKLNMEASYGSEWPAEEKMKRREMVVDEARYIFVHEISNKDANGGSELMDKKSTCNCNGPIVGFVHYRFVLEEEVPVVYIYELQLEPRVQGKGLGKFLMLLIELIACENKMGAVVLTVQRENLLAMDFYINKLRYSISATSPSRVDPLLGVNKSYEILCKTFDNEAQAVLKGGSYPLHPETFVCKTCEKTAGTTSTSSSTASSKVSPPFAKHTKCEKSMSTSSRRFYVDGLRWTNDLECLFIDIMHNEVIRGNFVGSIFTPGVWADIQRKLKDECDLNFNVKQLREKLSCIKTNWRKYKDLMLMDTGLGWDNERDVPLVDDNWWNLYLQSHPKDSNLRNKPCKRYTKLCTMFERCTATGSRARSSAQCQTHIQNDDAPTSEYLINLDVNDDNESLPTESGSSRQKKGKRQGLGRLINSFEIVTQSITSGMSDTSKDECVAVVKAIHDLDDVPLDLEAKAMEYFSAKRSRRQFFLASNPILRRAWLNWI